MGLYYSAEGYTRGVLQLGWLWAVTSGLCEERFDWSAEPCNGFPLERSFPIGRAVPAMRQVVVVAAAAVCVCAGGCSGCGGLLTESCLPGPPCSV